MEIPKVIFYGSATNKDANDGFDINKWQIEKIEEIIINAFEMIGFEIEIDFEIEKNGLIVGSKEKRPQRLIDANNINWNGIMLTAAFAEFVEHILNQQKEITLDNQKNELSDNSIAEQSHYVPHESYEYEENYDPCCGCLSFGSSGCLNECPYGD